MLAYLIFRDIFSGSNTENLVYFDIRYFDGINEVTQGSVGATVAVNANKHAIVTAIREAASAEVLSGYSLTVDPADWTVVGLDIS